MAAVNFYSVKKHHLALAFAPFLSFACQQSVSMLLYMSSLPQAEISEFRGIFQLQSNDNTILMLHHEQLICVANQRGVCLYLPASSLSSVFPSCCGVSANSVRVSPYVSTYRYMRAHICVLSPRGPCLCKFSGEERSAEAAGRPEQDRAALCAWQSGPLTHRLKL